MDIEQVSSLCARECIRQHVGLDRVAFLLTAYYTALKMNKDGLPTLENIIELSGIIEPVDAGKIRHIPVTFANGTRAVAPNDVPLAIERLFEHGLDENNTDVDFFVKSFLDIHPFQDGNGRTAFILYNWLNKSLDKPLTLPNYYGEK